MDENFRNQIKGLSRLLFTFSALFLISFIILFYVLKNPEVLQSKEEVLQDVVDIESPQENSTMDSMGFVDGEGMEITAQNCTGCHSAKLVTQNRMSREGWEATIRWMQETQNLWDLGNNEEIILKYLAKNYAPETKGRRQNLEDIKWYTLQ